VLFNTGWLELIGKDNNQFLETEPGIGMEAAQWLADQGIIAFGGDTWASEVYPNPKSKEEFLLTSLCWLKEEFIILN
jgi:kynurenine formamidase